MKLDVMKNMKKHNENLSIFACKDIDALRFNHSDDDFRTPFFRDIDKVLYSLSYIRYIDKTQVFTKPENDMVSKRMTHVQMVSKIARTIGRALNLNEDLIEAAGLGHDLGHVPFGHIGESILNKISNRVGEGNFMHNVQSVRTLMNIENFGEGSNITLQVLDAIFCHNGEKLEKIYKPMKKDKDEFLKEYEESYFDKNIFNKISPMTLEGCVVKISDIIAYIGKDIDDAVRIGKISFDDIPNDIADILGKKNSEIVNTIVCDIIENSIGNNYIKISDKVYDAMNKLIKFNYKYIYLKANTNDQIDNYENMFNALFDVYKKQIENKELNSDIYTKFLNFMNSEYLLNTTNRKVIDYIAGMTDDYFFKQYDKYIKN